MTQPEVTRRCQSCGEAIELVREGTVYRKDAIPNRARGEDRCACGSATVWARTLGFVDLWIADSVGRH